MLQIIGLVVCVYGIARLAQIPFEFRPPDNETFAIPPSVRFFALCVLSIGGALLIAALTVLLLTNGTPPR